jgi:hypothetical protein
MKPSGGEEIQAGNGNKKRQKNRKRKRGNKIT